MRKYLDNCVKDSQNVIKWHLRQEEMVIDSSLILLLLFMI